MEKALHIIHPYMYQIENETLVIGRSVNPQRDKKISDLASIALKNNYQIILHTTANPKYLCAQTLQEVTAIGFNEDLRFLVDNPEIVSVFTTNFGTPLVSDRPIQITEKKWKELEVYYDNTITMKAKIKPSDITLFIGGALERCVLNSIEHYKKELSQPHEVLKYIPELCVSYFPEEVEQAKKTFKDLNIGDISFENALEILSSN